MEDGFALSGLGMENGGKDGSLSHGSEVTLRLSRGQLRELVGAAVADRLERLELEMAGMAGERAEAEAGLRAEIERLRAENDKAKTSCMTTLALISGLREENARLREEIASLGGSCEDGGVGRRFVYAINPDFFRGAPTEWACGVWDLLLAVAEERTEDGGWLVASGMQVGAVYLALCALSRLSYPCSENKEWFVAGWNANVASRVRDAAHGACLRIACGTLRSAVSRSPLGDVSPVEWRRHCVSGDARRDAAFDAGSRIYALMRERLA